METESAGPRGLFVTGTDTGVGKTFVAAGIAAAFREAGLRTGVMKPVETGCRVRGGKRVPQDGRLLQKASGSEDPLEEIVPYRLLAAVAPRVAADREGVVIRLSAIERACRRIRSRSAMVLVEGAGGIFVPVTRAACMLDLIRLLGLPVLVVARAGLGTLNHTLLTLYCLGKEGIPVAGVVLNDVDGRRDLSKRTNPEMLRQASPVPILARIPHIAGLGPRASAVGAAAAKIGRRFSIPKLLAAMDKAAPPRF
ncbi:MAG: dethiobiotin synthase [bacterium]